MRNNRQPGFILILTFLMLSAAIALATYLVVSTQVSKSIGSTVLTRARSQDIALAGIELVRRTLSHAGDPEGNKQEVGSILRFINRWRTFALHEETDGVDATIQIYTTCEEGKININSMFDEQKKIFVIDEKDSFLKELWTRIGAIFRTKGTVGVTDFKDFLMRHLKGRKEPLDDVSELFGDEPLVRMPPVFTPLPMADEPGESKESRTQALGVYDIMTISEFMVKMQPLFLSRGMCELLGFKQLPSDDEGREKIIKDVLPKINLGGAPISWAHEWDKLLTPIYGKTFNQIEGHFRWTTFDQQIGAHIISVLCYGKMNNRAVGVFALLLRYVEHDKRVVYHVKKLYWI